MPHMPPPRYTSLSCPHPRHVLCPLPCMHNPLPCMPPVMHNTPYHACPAPPCMPPATYPPPRPHACSLCHEHPLPPAMHAPCLAHPHPVNRITDTCENTSLPQTSFAEGSNSSDNNKRITLQNNYLHFIGQRQFESHNTFISRSVESSTTVKISSRSIHTDRH